METKKRITFVVNPISGTHGKEFILRLIEKELNHSIYDYSIRKTEYAGHASEIAAHAAAEHTDIVVAIGGDGTINENICRKTSASCDYSSVFNDLSHIIQPPL